MLHSFSWLDDMSFELDFEVLHIHFVQKEISHLKNFILGSPSALVSCKNIV